MKVGEDARSLRYLQKNLWNIIERVINSQVLFPSAIANLRTRLNACRKMLGEIQYPNENDIISTVVFLYGIYLEKLNKLHLDATPVKVLINSMQAGKIEQSPEVERVLANLKEYIYDRILEFTRGFIVHGSIATDDYTNFSDIDAAIIVKDEVLTDQLQLKRLIQRIVGALKIILKFDNLQHHGFFIIPESFLRCYPENYLPIDVFRHARALHEPCVLEFKPYANVHEAEDSCAAMVRDICHVKLAPPDNLYEAKRLLSQFMLLPTLYLQSRGVFVYKRHSFEMVRKKFPEGWWAMDEAGKARQDWIRPGSILFKTLVATMPNPWIASAAYRKLNWQIPHWLAQRLNPKFYEGTVALAREMSA